MVLLTSAGAPLSSDGPSLWMKEGGPGETRPLGALSTCAAQHRAQAECFPSRKYKNEQHYLMKRMKTLHFWVTSLSLKDLFLRYVVKHIFQDNKENDLKDLSCSVLVRKEFSFLASVQTATENHTSCLYLFKPN